jgi:apolipoprotein N-acyltransferase
MDSKRSLVSIFAFLAAVSLSGAALYRARGLDPIWWMMWLAAVPLLMLAPRVSACNAFSASALAWIVGGLATWTYYRQLRLPLWLILVALFMPAIVFGLSRSCTGRFFAADDPRSPLSRCPACGWRTST